MGGGFGDSCIRGIGEGGGDGVDVEIRIRVGETGLEGSLVAR